jgi:hypothetical protein
MFVLRYLFCKKKTKTSKTKQSLKNTSKENENSEDLENLENLESINNFFRDFKYKSNETRDFFKNSYTELRKRVEEVKCEIESKIENLNTEREKLIRKVDKQMKSKLEQASSNLIAINDIYDYKFIANKKTEFKFDYLIGDLIDKSDIVTRIKHAEFFNKIDHITTNLNLCLEESEQYARTFICGGSIINTQLIAILLHFPDRNRKILLFDLSKSSIIKVFDLKESGIYGKAQLSASKNYLLYYNNSEFDYSSRYAEKLIIFDNQLNINIQRNCESAVYHACLTSYNIITSVIRIDPMKGKYNKYRIEYHDRKFSKIDKPPIVADRSKFDANDNYLIYTYYNRSDTKSYFVLHNHIEKIFQFDSDYFWNDYLCLNGIYLFTIQVGRLHVINVFNGQKITSLNISSITGTCQTLFSHSRFVTYFSECDRIGFFVHKKYEIFIL